MSEPIKPSTESPVDNEVISTTTPTIIYVLYLTSLVFAVTGLIGLIMAYVNRGGNAEFLESHYQFQIRTFWIGLLYLITGAILSTVFIGWVVIFFSVVWIIIRCAKGIKLLNHQKEIPDPKSWMFG